ncbi:nuclear valosin-containing protein-like isoform X3 [Trichomycterus rosablanca]|uniref:nuclear valosin-containing protein-like isoform X3 n=1 Tax=Trichomycterus rosablanca TaxID=2290929 RepID=UPI002F357B67
MKNRSGGATDQRLKHRVQQYLKSSNSQYVDISAVAADLQRLYRIDYGRRNKTAFRIQVEKVYDVIHTESGLSPPEEEHSAKRARRSQEDSGEDGGAPSDSTDSEEDEDEDSTEREQSTDHMNGSLKSLYSRGNPAAPEDGAPRRGPRPAPATGASPPPPGGWFIDTSGSRDREEGGLIDLCGEAPASTARADESNPPAPEPEHKPRRSRKKEKRRRDAEGKDGDAEAAAKKGRIKTPELQRSSVKFEDVGGNEETLTELCKLLIHLRHPEVYQQLGVVPPRGFLLHGPPGCGKTLLAQAVAGEMDLPMLKVSAPELVSGISGESEQKLRELFEQAVSSAPCIMFIDEIDAITPKREVASKDMERRMVAQLLTCMDDLNSLSVPAQVLVIGATNRPDSLDPALRRAGRFDREICLGIPDEGARLRILQTLCRRLKLPAEFDFLKLARLTPGYVGADLMALCREAAMSAVNRVLLRRTGTPSDAGGAEGGVAEASDASTGQQGELERLLCLLRTSESLSEDQLAGLCVLMDDFRAALGSVQPSAKREGFATVPDVTWEDVGALQDIRDELAMAILAPVRSPEQFRALGLNAPAGVLLAGPPGCGKTLLAKAVANESGLNFISVKGPELLNMYVGESERAVRQVFQRGRNSAPCVIFFDEVDALCPRRSGHESGASVRVVNQLLTEMDGLESRRQVFIMAATNRPDIIDPAVLRPGRLDRTLYVGLPPPEDRHAILLTITKGGTRPALAPDVSLAEIAHDDRCECFTGADLSALVREASVNALRARLCSRTGGGPSGNNNTSTSAPPTDPPVTAPPGPAQDVRVSRQNFEDAFKKVRPSVSKKDQAMYEKLRESLSR